jgi:hypothetical protein
VILIDSDNLVSAQARALLNEGPNDFVSRLLLHAPIITEPQAVSSLGSDFFQIFSEVSR